MSDNKEITKKANILSLWQLQALVSVYSVEKETENIRQLTSYVSFFYAAW